LAYVQNNQRPIVSIFLPNKEIEMERKVDQETGEIIGDSDVVSERPKILETAMVELPKD